MLITRKVEFSAAHRCYDPALSEEENRARYGEAANPHGHGHNYVLEVTLEGAPDPVTGMIVDLRTLKDVLEREVVAPMDHRFLNREVPPFDRVVPTAENVAIEIWRRLAPRLEGLYAVRLYETADLYVEYFGERAGRLTRRYRFSASHRLHSDRLPEEDNRALYGKCNNPYGHGHDYVLEVSAGGPVAPAALDALVRDEVLRALDHKDLNSDVPEFAAAVPTTENLALVIRDRLRRRWPAAWPPLERLRIEETPRNSFELR